MKYTISSLLAGVTLIWILVSCGSVNNNSLVDTNVEPLLTASTKELFQAYPDVILSARSWALVSFRYARPETQISEVNLDWNNAGQATDEKAGKTTAFVPFKKLDAGENDRMLVVTFVTIDSSHTKVLSTSHRDSIDFNYIEVGKDQVTMRQLSKNGLNGYFTEIYGLANKKPIIRSDHLVTLGGTCNVPQSLQSALTSAQWNVGTAAAAVSASTIALYVCAIPGPPCLAALAAKAVATGWLISAGYGLQAAQQAIAEWKAANCR